MLSDKLLTLIVDSLLDGTWEKIYSFLEVNGVKIDGLFESRGRIFAFIFPEEGTVDVRNVNATYELLKSEFPNLDSIFLIVPTSVVLSNVESLREEARILRLNVSLNCSLVSNEKLINKVIQWTT